MVQPYSLSRLNSSRFKLQRDFAMNYPRLRKKYSTVSECSRFVFKAMFTLYRIGFCSVSQVAPIQCEQELMFCSGAEIVPKRSQCEHKPYPAYNLQRSPLISKDHLTVRASVAISALIKCSDLTRSVSKTYPIRNVPLSTAERSSSVPKQKLLRKQRS